MNTRNRIAVAAVAAMLVLPAACLGLQAFLRNEITVVNHSGAPLQEIAVTLPWQTLHFGALADGDSCSSEFAIRHDAGFNISGTAADGRQFHFTDGYVTNGQHGERVRVEIGRAGTVTLRQGAAAQQ